MLEASGGAGAQEYVCNVTVVASIPTRQHEIRSGVEVKRGVDFLNSTSNALKKSVESGEGSVLTLSFLGLPFGIYTGYSAKLIFLLILC